MAASWAITGDMGPWADAVGKRATLTKSSLVNSSPTVKRAVVCLSGIVDQRAFTLTRGVDARGKGARHPTKRVVFWVCLLDAMYLYDAMSGIGLAAQPGAQLR